MAGVAQTDQQDQQAGSEQKDTHYPIELADRSARRINLQPPFIPPRRYFRLLLDPHVGEDEVIGCGVRPQDGNRSPVSESYRPTSRR